MKRIGTVAVALIAALAMSPGAANAAAVPSASPATVQIVTGEYAPDGTWGIWDKFCEAFPRLCT